MNNIKEILLNEYKKYPSMEITDYMKLIFQHVNGGNHLLINKEKALQYLLDEYQEVTTSKDVPLYEDIGNNIVRINLARYKYQGLDINKLFEIFVLSASSFTKDIKAMEEAFLELKNLAKEKKIPLNIEELEEFLSWYRKNDYPLLSHSEIYKKLYNPHYRIILSSYLNNLLN